MPRVCTPAPAPRRSLVALVLVGLAACGGRSDEAQSSVAVPEVSLAGAEAPLAELLRDRVGAVRRAPADAEAWGALAYAYDAHDYAAEAIECYERASTLAPTEQRWPYLAGVATYATDQVAALKWFDEAEARGSVHPPLFVRRGLGRLLVGEVERARADIDRATELDPALTAAWLASARVALAEDDVEAAQAALERAGSFAPRTSEIHSLWAEVHRRRGDETASSAALARVTEGSLREAMPDALRSAVEAAGVTLTWTRRRASAALELGDAKGALEIWRTAERRAPDDPRVRIGTAEAMLRQGLTAEAEGHLARTAELVAAKEGAFDSTLRGQLAQQQGIAALALRRPDDAAAHFERALGFDPELHVARGNLGVIRLQQGSTATGLELLRAASEGLGADTPVRVNLLNAVIDAGLWDEAEQLVGDLVTAAPNDPLLVFLRGRVHVGKQRFAEAAADFARVAELDPSHETAPVNEARAYLAVGDEARAAAVLRAAHSRLPQSRLVMQRLAWLVATARDEAVVDGSLATFLAKKVMGAAPEYPEYLELAAAAFAAAGEMTAAVTHEEFAIEGLTKMPESAAPPRRPELLAAMQKRLVEYRAGRRWREPMPATASK